LGERFRLVSVLFTYRQKNTLTVMKERAI
jgi:hypothetical protein